MSQELVDLMRKHGVHQQVVECLQAGGCVGVTDLGNWFDDDQEILHWMQARLAPFVVAEIASTQALGCAPTAAAALRSAWQEADDACTRRASRLPEPASQPPAASHLPPAASRHPAAGNHSSIAFPKAIHTFSLS